MFDAVSNRIIEIIRNGYLFDWKDDETFKEMSLFDLGFNSIKYIQLVLDLEEKYQIEFPDEYLDSHANNVNSLSEYIEKIISANKE